MIVILSNSNDFSTNDIVDWLSHWGLECLRLNPDDTRKFDYFNKIENSKLISGIKFEDVIISNKTIKSFWYRRGFFFNPEGMRYPSCEGFEKEKQLFLSFEKKTLIDYFNSTIDEKKKIGSYDKYEINKLDILRIATEIGLNIPTTLITSKKEELTKFYERLKERVIMKPILNGIHKTINGNFYNMFTKQVNRKTIENLPDNFFETVFQEEIDKKLELRIFYLNRRFFPMAIFSQKDKKTEIDFRRYNTQNPNRKVPFELPEYLKQQLIKLMVTAGLNSGSIDMIYTLEKKFVFLEVNPVGQFKMTSYPCNYNIEKEIAISLSKR